jgi:hypothetical protein
MDKTLGQNVRTTVRKWWTRIRHAGAVERPREWTDAQAWAEGALTGLQAEQAREREEFAATEGAWFAARLPDPSRAPRENYYHAQAARYCSVAGWSLTLLEAVFAGGLSILLLTLPLIAAVAVGVVITVLLALGLKGWVSAKVARFQERPKEGRDWALRLLTWTAPVALVALLLLFLMRGLAGWWVVVIFPIATALAALVTPVIAGALLTLAALYRWSTDYTVRYRELEQAEREVLELRDAAKRGLAGTAPATTRPTLTSTLGKTGTAVLLALALWNSAACNGIEAAGTTTGRADVQTSALPTGEWWFDETISIDQRDVPATHQVVVDSLLETSARTGVPHWLFYGFGEEPWREQPFYELTLPTWQPPICEPPNEASKVFKMQQADQLAQCATRTKAARTAYDQQLQDQLVQLRIALDNHRPKPTRCTGLGDLLERIAQTPDRRAIGISSDGRETCRPTGLPTVAAPLPGTHVSWILIGSTPAAARGQTLGEQFTARRDVLLRAAPWLHIVAPWQVTPDLFTPTP